MTPHEVAERLFELGILFQVKERHPSGGLNELFGGMQPGNKEDFSETGFNAEEEEDGEEDKENDKEFLDVLTEVQDIRRYNAWFLSANPPTVYKGKIIGKVMSCQIVDRNFNIRLEDVPWGLKAGIFSMNCEYITSLEYKTGTLYVASKVGNLAIQIHEISETQCTQRI